MWYLIPLIDFLAMGIISHQSGKELKEDIEKYKLTKKWL
ncbi:hypothetical protein ES705_31420 [subsurface metagenome]